MKSPIPSGICLLIATTAFALGTVSRAGPKKEKRDLLAKATAESFLKALTLKKDLDEIMKTVDVPFIFHGMKNIKDRKALRAQMEFFVKRARQSKDQGKLKIQKIYSIAEFSAKLKLTERYRQLLQEVLAKSDRVIVYTIETNPPRDDRAAIFVRIRDGKAKVVGVD